MLQEGIDCTNLTIDTVERYQGGGEGHHPYFALRECRFSMETLIFALRGRR